MQDSAQPKSFLEVLASRAKQAPDRMAFLFLENGDREAARLTFGELEERARSAATRLLTVALPGDRALLLYPSGLDFIVAFLGCLYAGVIAVPAYPPRRNRSDERLRAVVRDCTPVVALMSGALSSVLGRGAGSAKIGQLPTLTIDRSTHEPAADSGRPDVGRETLAFLQYTSGSTGTPKGVMVSHGNILANVKQITACTACGETTVCVSWLPLFHDMGLLGKVLAPIYFGGMTVLMDPGAFVQKPVRWLQAVTKYRATVSAAPDSAYVLCARKVTDAEKAGLDLSCWSVALNGAEPVQASSVERFTRAFSACGFRTEAMRSVYGMAEATLFIAGQPAGTLPMVKGFDADGLSRGVAEETMAETTGTSVRELVSCGSAWDEHQLRIVNAETGLPARQREIGEIWFAGPSVAKGYWNRPEESESTFQARTGKEKTAYLRTGDLGFLDGRELFINGRLKDLIIIAGRNLYPQDLERAAEQSEPALALNASAAFSVEVDGEERIVLVCEVRREALRHLDSERMASKIRRALSEQYEASLQAVVFLRPASIPRTTSGKIQRSRTRLAYLRGDGLEIAGQWQKPEIGVLEAQKRGEDDLTSWLLARVSLLSGIAADKLDPHEPFSSYGLASSDAIALSGELQERLGRMLPPTLVYDYPSVALVARHLTAQPEERRAEVSADRNEEIALIGMACRFPGANDPEAFWRLLQEGRDAVVASPSRVEGLPPTGLLEEVERFDAEFFGINAREAEMMDPQQRLLLEVSWEAVENAGVAPQSLAGTRTAVMVGISNCDYARLTQRASVDTGPYASTGNALSVAANRISYALDLRGPSWIVDTACSSSLVALHQACNSLRRGECDAALVGGANLILTPQLSAAFTQAGLLSPDGECRTFDAEANGYVRGEGIGVVLLKRLSDAIRDGDRIQAVIRGTAVNQDGRSNGLTAPNGPAQQAVIREALRTAGVQAREIGLVEAHGTGTPLGDPIELNSLMEVLGEGRAASNLCWIGSVKTNIGHLESAAGIAGVIKTVLALQHREIPPHLHFHTINPYIAIAGKPFRVPERAVRWEAKQAPRLAGVSSFGFGGTNSHVVLAESPEFPEVPVQRPATEQPVGLLAFSARTPSALLAMRLAYAGFLRVHPEISLDDFASTVNRSRTLFTQERTALVFSNREELIAGLSGEQEANARNPEAPSRRSDPKANDSGAEFSSGTSDRRAMLNQLAAEYRNGKTVDWATLDHDYQRKRLALPTYPFERQRFWIDAREGAHPLLGRRLEQQAHLPSVWTWESRLGEPATGLLEGRRTGASASLSYSAYVEMALAAAVEIGEAKYSIVSDLSLAAPLLFRDRDPRRVQTVLSRQPGGRFSFAVYQQDGATIADAAPWQLCARAEIHERDWNE
jgi:acyl-CoA synthetase (AMP-forming)/AMP-acid ligase II/3-oxoacyl-(acyl-carrier-protein) synthase/acyl carrier protein